MAHILIVHPASLSDVCLSLRLVYAVALSYPQHQFTYLLKPSITGVVIAPPPNLEPMTMDLKKSDADLRGLFSLGQKLLYERFDVVLDLFNTGRTRFLGAHLRLWGGAKYYAVAKRYSCRVAYLNDHIPYERGEEYLRAYEALFQKARLSPLGPTPCLTARHPHNPSFPVDAIGFAPQQKHGERLSWAEIYRRASYIRELFSAPVLLFGVNSSTGEEYEEVRSSLRDKGIYRVGNLTFSQELALLSSLACFIGLDASPIRMAELVDIPTYYIGAISRLEEEIAPCKEQIKEIITKKNREYAHEYEDKQTSERNGIGLAPRS